jgi:hypothetical protein
MKKSQVSIEFMILFAIIFFIFIALAGFFPEFLDKINTNQKIAQQIVDDVKVKTISDSLSQSDFETIVQIPKKINGVYIDVDVEGSSDNIILIKQKDSGFILARAFLPKIDAVNGTFSANGFVLKIKKESNLLTIERS